MLYALVPATCPKPGALHLIHRQVLGLIGWRALQQDSA